MKRLILIWGSGLLLGWILHESALCQERDSPKPEDHTDPLELNIETFTIDESDTGLSSLLRRRYNEAVSILDYRWKQFPRGGGDYESKTLAIESAYQQVIHSALELQEPIEATRARMKTITDSLNFVEMTLEARLKLGFGSKVTLSQIRYLRLDIEIRMKRLQEDQK